MQEINHIMTYVHAQRDCRGLGLKGGIQKKTLLTITHKVKKCIKLFREISFEDKQAVLPSMKKIAKDFNVIFVNEETEEKKRISEAFKDTVAYMRYMAPKVQIAPEPDELLSNVKPQKRMTPAEFYKNEVGKSVSSKLTGFFSGNDRGGHFEVKNFIEDVLKKITAKKANKPRSYRITQKTVGNAFLKKADKMYSSSRRQAGEIFIEEEMDEVSREYHRQVEVPDENYSYKNFDQNLLGKCVEAYDRSLTPTASKDLAQAWGSCELIYYRIGHRAEDFEQFKRVLTDTIEQGHDSAKNILYWDRCMNVPVSVTKTGSQLSSSDEESYSISDYSEDDLYDEF